MEICYAYLDTNTFLHYERFEEIDWCKILNSKKVIITICSAVTKELDEKKFLAPDLKIRDRAKKIISKLNEIEETVGSNSIRDNVELHFITKEPTIDWVSEGLDPQIYDDRIIATILCENSDLKDSIILVTVDTGLKLKAKSKNITKFTLPNELLLPSVKTKEQKELEKLVRRVAELEGRIPDLKLKLISEDGHTDFLNFKLKTIPLLTERERKEKTSARRQELVYSGPAIPLATAIWFKPSQEEIKRYKKEVEKHLLMYEKYLILKWKYNELLSRSIKIRFGLLNNGNSPSEDIDIFLNFPDGLEVKSEETFPDKPIQPEKPNPPRTPLHRLTESIKPLDFTWPVLRDTGNFSTESDSSTKPKIKKTNSYEVSYKIDKLKHFMDMELDAVYVIFPNIEEAFSFPIGYSIIAENVPDKIEGKLRIVVEK